MGSGGGGAKRSGAVADQRIGVPAAGTMTVGMSSRSSGKACGALPLAPQCLRYSHRPVIDLARRLIALQVRIDSDEDSLCLWLLLAVLFFAYGGRCRLLFVVFYSLSRWCCAGSLTSDMATTKLLAHPV